MGGISVLESSLIVFVKVGDSRSSRCSRFIFGCEFKGNGDSRLLEDVRYSVFVILFEVVLEWK